MRKLLLLTGAFIASLAIGTSIFKTTPVENQRLSAVNPSEDEEKEDKMDHPLKFIEFHKGIRTRDGENEPGYQMGAKWSELQKARQSAFARRRSNGRTKSNGILEYKERGPANVPGRTRALYNVAGDPTNNTWLAGAATGGIWRTTNGGTSWSERSVDFPALPIASFAGDQSGSVIYAATGEYISSLYSAIGNGIFKSTDGGLTWQQLPSTSTTVTGDFAVATRMICHPTNPNLILVTTATHELNPAIVSKIMRSTDGGTTWTMVKEVQGAFEQIIASPDNFNIQYAAQRGVGIWKSTDAGQTWSLSNQGMSPSGRVEMSISPVDPNRLYAAAVGNLGKTGADLYFSDDAGATWTLLDVKFNNVAIDFFGGQGFYDNTVMADPFDKDRVYIGGVNLFRTTIQDGTSIVDNYDLLHSGSNAFLNLLSFSNAEFSSQRLTVGKPNPTIDVEVRFGPGVTQMAHQFLVPTGKTSGVTVPEYSYNAMVSVPFQVWDVTNNKQLTISFRDQNRNGKFDLVPQYFSTTPATDFLNDSREYLYINGVEYTPNAVTEIAKAGGQEYKLVYNIYPSLATGATWTPETLPVAKLTIDYTAITKRNGATVTVSDAYSAFDAKNISNQIDMDQGLHPDHHFMIPLIDNATEKKYRLLLGNDGGVFVSKSSTTPGITNGDWTFKGFGYNTSQFYSVDKKAGEDSYIGGLQDNGTRISVGGQSASSTTPYLYAIGGDGFDVLWHTKDTRQILGCVYYGDIRKSGNSGGTFGSGSGGLTTGSANFSFFTKLANNKLNPDRVFTVGTAGVYVSNTFGNNWTLTPITQNWIYNTNTYQDVEVSRANPNIVWAGTGMSEIADRRRNLHVSVDGGKTFTMTNNYTGAVLGHLTRIESHPTQPNTAYAIFGIARTPKILRTTDLGQTWEDITGFGNGTSSTNGFPDVVTYCLYVRTDNPNILWAGTEIGIVESLDNGQTWALLEDFPKVTVWEMKGQDNQIVIGTHGRGIWTATTEATQQPDYASTLVAIGTHPNSNLMMRWDYPTPYDSVQVYINSSKRITYKNIQAGVQEHELTEVNPGYNEVYNISYLGDIPVRSKVYAVNKINVIAAANSYAKSDFSTASDLILDNVTSGSMVNLKGRVLQSAHNYVDNREHEIIIRQAITVAANDAFVYLRDMAITEPGKDTIVVEATKNGLDWVTIGDSYDASFNEAWLDAYESGSAGTADLLELHDFDISNHFEVNDVLLFRVRFLSDESENAWGWALNYIGIQEAPEQIVTNTERDPLAVKVNLFPNPTKGALTLEYTLAKPSNVSVRTMDVTGKEVSAINAGMQQAGKHTQAINLQGQTPGQYIVIIKAGKNQKTVKVSLVR